MSVEIVDTRGLNCPLPVLRARKRLQQLDSGAEIVILASDPATANDVPAFCQAAGHTLLESQTEPDELRFRIRKGN